MVRNGKSRNRDVRNLLYKRLILISVYASPFVLSVRNLLYKRLILQPTANDPNFELMSEIYSIRD